MAPGPAVSGRRFVLLDRDGTINEELVGEYVLRPESLVLIPGAIDGIRILRDLGFGVVVVTNQSPVGRAWITIRELDAIHDRLREMLAAGGASVDRIYACPHEHEDGCDCRKPRPGLALRAAAELGFDPSDAFVVGDHESDVGLGRAIGATTILVRSGYGAEEAANGATELADHVADDLRQAAGIIRDLVASGEPATR